jgi:PAS domain S-box-containing protein
LLLWLAVLGLFLARLVTRPLDGLIGAAEQLAGGVLEEPPAAPAGRDEMARLARGLRAVYRRFQESMAYLAQSERRYRDLFENSPDPGYVISRGGFVMEVNQALERVLGRSRQEVHGLHLGQMLQPGQDMAMAQRLEEVARAGRAVSSLDFTVMDNQGRPRNLEGFITPLLDGQGRILGYYGLARDLTEQQELQQQLLQAQKMEIMGTLAGGLAHDFNNLLSGILGYSSLILAQPGLEPRLRRYLQIMDNSASQAAALTQQLLSLAKVGHAGRQAVEINSVVSDVLTILEHSLQSRVRVELRLGSDLPVVEADPGQLHQVLMNLCINARDAMPQGGTLVLETSPANPGEHPEVVGPGSRALVVSVQDSGQGMDATTRLHALEPFFTTKEQGTGLGLAMAQGIIQNHGGAMEIDSQPGLGTRVRLYLPPGRAGLTIANPLLPAELVGGQETVLVVDDEPAVRELALESLALCGYRTLAAASGEEALTVLERSMGQVDMVLLDLLMPGMGGLELLPLLKERFAGVPVILVSGMYDPREEGQAPWLLADAFLPKPYRVPALLGLVRQVLDRAPVGCQESFADASPTG